jgi:hypothetical protein
MPRLLLAALLLAQLLTATHGGRPADCPCITWEMDDKCSNQNHFGWPTCSDYLFDPSPWAWQWIMNANSTGGTCAKCSGSMKDFDCGYVFPCFADGPDMWGHRDIDISNVGCKFQFPNGSAGHQCAEWVPKKGAAWQHFGWQVAQNGGKPSVAMGQLITDPTGEYVLARSPAASPFLGCLPGSIGWVKLQPNGLLGCMRYASNIIPVTMCNGFEVAYCKQCKPCPSPYNSSFSPGPGCPKCVKPPVPPPPPAPPAPPPPPAPGGTPCIRFGNAVPSDNIVDATITQGAVTHTWSNYRFGQFSDWVSVFSGGKGTITLKDHASGATLLSTSIPLTPGPLVVVVKDTWPPKEAKNVEAIAASFVPPANGSAVRLFNLASDVPSAGLHGDGGKVLANGIKYTLGSDWAPISSDQQTFTAVSDAGGATLATAQTTPPAAPEVFTAFLLGSAAYRYTLLPQVDAPETGPCKPMAVANAE